MFEVISLEALNLNTTKKDLRVQSYLNLEHQEAADFILAGYPDDEGIKNNSGRPGASLGPNAIREFLFKMTPPAFRNPDTALPILFDLGNLKTSDTDLASRHEVAISTLDQTLTKNQRLISFGGGHDYGYVDGKWFLDQYGSSSNSKIKPIIFNFDAHLDVRPLTQGITSGTPFYRLLELGGFDFYEIGIQEQCNSLEHIQWLRDKGGQIISFRELYSDSEHYPCQNLNFNRFKRILETEIDPLRPCFISVDIDAFSNAFAMGCSQSFATGFDPMGFFQMFCFLLDQFDVRGLGIYEVSPPLDQDHRTAKLAAQIAYKYIHHFDAVSKNRKQKV